MLSRRGNNSAAKKENSNQVGAPSTPSRASSSSPEPKSSASKAKGTPSSSTGSGLQKGLRQFSLMVCQKVEAKGRTTYQEVADELVEEFSRDGNGGFDHKNIRRRVYDALNVLMAMEIIEKDKNKKEIRWLGLPTDIQQNQRSLQAEIKEREERIEQKKKLITELLQRQISIRNLVKRNTALEESDSQFRESAQDRLQLPFVLINAPKNATINCEMLEDRSQYYFDFDVPFLINEDVEVLRLMNLHKISLEEAKTFIPPDLISYLPAQCVIDNESLPGVNQQVLGGNRSIGSPQMDRTVSPTGLEENVTKRVRVE